MNQRSILEDRLESLEAHENTPERSCREHNAQLRAGQYTPKKALSQSPVISYEQLAPQVKIETKIRWIQAPARGV